MINKKGQEEIVGFVLIIVIVSIAFLILFGFLIRQDGGGEKESRDVYQLMESMMKYTSECAIGFEPAYSDLGELFEKCRTNTMCTSGKKACQVLNETLKEVLDASIFTGGEAYVKGFEFKTEYDTNKTREIIIEISKGNCTGNEKRGAEYSSPAFPGKIISSLNMCF